MNEVIAILAGIGLAAACGFRVFLPLFAASLAVRAGIDGVAGFELAALIGPKLEWIASTPAILSLGTATLVEIGAYYIPWFDNALDILATPAAMIAGTLVAFGLFPESGGGALDWALAAIAGGGTAGLIQSGSVALRGASSATTGGLGNFAVATLELIGAALASLLAIFLPLIAGGLALALILYILIRLARRAIPAPTSGTSPP